MPYILAAVIITMAVVLFIFTGVWGGLLWIVVAGIAAVLLFQMRASSVPSTASKPTGRPRADPGSGTANDRVGQD